MRRLRRTAEARGQAGVQRIKRNRRDIDGLVEVLRLVRLRREIAEPPPAPEGDAPVEGAT
jgi:hypothetical protein